MISRSIIADKSTRYAIVAAIALGLTIPTSTAGNNLLLALVLIFWLASGDWRGKLDRSLANPVVIATVLLMAYAALGMLWGEGSGAERWQYFDKYLRLLLVVMMISLPLNARDGVWALALFVFAMAVTLLFSFLLYFGLMPEEWFPAVNTDVPIVFKGHITQGLFLSVAGVVAAVAALHARTPGLRISAALFALLACAGVLITPGRTGYLALAFALVYFLIHALRWRGLLIASVGAIVGLAVITQLPQLAGPQRIVTGIEELQNWQYGQHDQSSVGLRLQYAATSLLIIKDHPVSGVGTGGFETAYREKISTTQAVESNNPHNQYLLTAAQLGLPGLLLLLALGATVWRTAARLAPPYCLLARCILLMMAAGNLFNSFLYDHSELVFSAWILGLLFSGLPRPAKSA